MATQPDKTGIPEFLERIGTLCPSGYAIALHIHFTTPAYLFQTYPRDWMEYYSQKGLVMHDPTVRWGFAHTGLRDWADMADDDPQGVLEAAARHGLVHGFTVALNDAGSRSVASFSRPDRPHDAAERDEIAGIVTELHRRTADADTLTEAERTALHEMSVTLTHPSE